MRQKFFTTAMLVLALAVSLAAGAQTPAATQGQTQSSPEGIDRGGYNIQQSIELGYRFTDITTPHNGGDDTAMFNTFINLHQGPRLLEQTFSMRSLANNGVLFDNLAVTSFGWGGDPNNVARVRLEKNKFYNFSAAFRRDQNYFDYNLLANPLRTAADSTLNPNVTFSPHSFFVRRRMFDTDLTLMPQSRFNVRLGYSRNRADGPSYSSYHEGVDILTYAPWNTTYQTYKFGFDMRFIPKTNISFDQIIDTGKQDTNYFLAPFAGYKLPGAVDGVTTVEFGLPAATATCINGSATYFRGCSGYTSYNRLQRVRTTTPTSQLSFQSRPSDKVELMGRVSYSWTDLTSPFSENFTGLVTRTHERALWEGGAIQGNALAASGDVGVTFHVTDKISVSDTFRFVNNRQPMEWTATEGSVLILTTGTNSFSQCNPLPTTTTAACRYTAPGTPSEIWATTLNQNLKWNTIQVDVKANKTFGFRAGYRYGSRKIGEAMFEPAAEAGASSWDLTEHTALFGAWIKPSRKFRTNVEVELSSNDGTGVGGAFGTLSGPLTRLSPAAQQHYRIRSTYSPTARVTFSGTLNLLQNANDNKEINYQGYNRNIGFATNINANKNLSFDLAYNYNGFRQANWMCFVDSFGSLPAGTVGPSNATNPTAGCPTWNASSNPTPYYLYSDYQNTAHFFSGTVVFHPVKRVSGVVGYSVTSVDGQIPVLNAFQPLGTLKYNFHQPLASLSFELEKNWTFNAYYNYDQYKEGSFTGATDPRYFHDNRAMLTLRYAF